MQPRHGLMLHTASPSDVVPASRSSLAQSLTLWIDVKLYEDGLSSGFSLEAFISLVLYYQRPTAFFDLPQAQHVNMYNNQVTFVKAASIFYIEPNKKNKNRINGEFWTGQFFGVRSARFAWTIYTWLSEPDSDSSRARDRALFDNRVAILSCQCTTAPPRVRETDAAALNFVYDKRDQYVQPGRVCTKQLLGFFSCVYFILLPPGKLHLSAAAAPNNCYLCGKSATWCCQQQCNVNIYCY